MTALTQLRDEVNMLKTEVGWDEFRRVRQKEWDPLLHRDAEVKLDPRLKAFAAGTNIQSPLLERVLTQVTQIEKIKPTKIDVVCKEDGKDAVKDVEDVRIWMGSWWGNKLNKNRRLDGPRSRAQWRYGFACEFMGWNVPLEPMPEGGEDMEDVSGQPASAFTMKKDRTKAYASQQGDTWTIRTASALSILFGPDLDDPSLYILEANVKYIDAYGREAADGSRLTLDEQGKIRWLGALSPLPEWTGQGSSKKSLTVYIKAWRDPETRQWRMAEYIADDLAKRPDDGKLIKEVVVPGGRSPFFIIPSGDEDPLEDTPHRRYRPGLYPLYVAIQENNFWRTMIAAYGLMFTRNFYIDLNKLNPAAKEFAALLFPESDGPDRFLGFKWSDPASDEVSMLPELTPMPSQINEGIVRSLDENIALIKDLMPSRFQVGNPSRSEVTYGTATTMVDMEQQSALPHVNNLTNQDAYGTVAELTFMKDCVVYWDSLDETEDAAEGAAVIKDTAKDYPEVTTGAEPLLRGGKPAGTKVVVTAAKCKHDMQVFAVTKNQTLSEEQQEFLVTMQQEDRRMITHKQALATKWDDPEAQTEELRKEDLEKLQKPGADNALRLMLNAMYMARSNVNLAALQGLPPPSPPPLPEPAQSEPVALAPNRTPGAPPVERPAYQATVPAPVPPPIGPQVAPSPQSWGSQGGSSPVGTGAPV